MDNAENKGGVNRSRNASSDEIKEEIDRARGKMDETIDELTERLNPRHVLDDVMDYFRTHKGELSGKGREMKDTATRVGQSMLGAVRDNPVPAILIGAGVAWWIYEQNRSADLDDDEFPQLTHNSSYEEHDYENMASAPGTSALPAHYAEMGENGGSGIKDRISSGASAAKDKISSSAQAAREKLSGAAHTVRDAASRTASSASEKARQLGRRAKESTSTFGSNMKHKAQDGYQYTGEKFSDLCRERPLAVGLGFLALGLFAGLALPRTRKEHELVGRYSERLMSEAKHRGEEILERGKHVAQATLESAKNEAKEAGLTPEQLKNKATEIGRNAAQTVKSEAREEAQQFTS